MAPAKQRATRLKLLLNDVSIQTNSTIEGKRTTRQHSSIHPVINDCGAIDIRRQAESKLKLATRHSKLSIARTIAAYENIFALKDLEIQNEREPPSIMPTKQILCQGCEFTECDLISLLHTPKIPINNHSIINNITGLNTSDVTNQNALALLKSHGVIPSNLYCPKPTCSKRRLSTSNGSRFRCYKRLQNKRQCNYSVSIYRNTFFDKFKKSPSLVLLFMNYWLRQSYNQRHVANNLGIDNKTCVAWKKHCDIACYEYLISTGPHMIGGTNVIIEIDETVIYKDFKNLKTNDKRSAKYYWIFGGIERHSMTYNSFSVPLAESIYDEELDREVLRNLHRDFDTLVEILLQHVRPGSIIITDGWGAYDKLGHPIQGVIFYQHKVINHKNGFVLEYDRLVHTNNIESFWLYMKSFIKRPGNQLKNIWRNLARFQVLLMLKRKSRTQWESYENMKKDENGKLHNFLHLLGQLYPHSYV